MTARKEPDSSQRAASFSQPSLKKAVTLTAAAARKKIDREDGV